MILKEIGLEAEYWLLDIAGHIQEAPAYNFPSDEMGFLVEIRSGWGANPQELVKTLKASYQLVEDKAGNLGMAIDDSPFKDVSSDWQKYIATKYNHDKMEDKTRNIYMTEKRSHHTGFNENVATAGLHIHFSLFETDTERFIPIEEDMIEVIVLELDSLYGGYIEAAGRIAGEWEPKPSHKGFEYRSLPTDVPHYKTALDALLLFDRLTPELE